jgi:AcrR family transcriptional regulator
MILTIQNAIPTEASDVTERIVQRTLSRRQHDYASEVRRLLDAALQLMGERGTSATPRVADIVGAAGLSNDAFYRHFKSKDDLVTAILEDGAARLCGYLSHQMAKERTPEGQVRQWVKGVLAQADAHSAAATRAVLWNGGSAGGGLAAGRHFAAEPLAALLAGPFAELGSPQPALDATLAAHAALGVLSDYLWGENEPTRADVERVGDFCLRVVSPAR